MRLLCLLALLLVLAALPASAAGGPDRLTGGVAAPDGRLTGGGADGGEPATTEAEGSAVSGAGAGPPGARTAQSTGEPEARPAPQQPEDDDVDVEVRVPVPEEPQDRPVTASPQGSGLGGLAETGFAVAALAAAGALCAGVGLALRRLARC